MAPSLKLGWRASHDDLSPEQQVEYDMHEHEVRRELGDRDRWMMIAAWPVLFGPLAILLILVASTQSWREAWAQAALIVVVIVGPSVWLGLHITLIVRHVRRKRHARASMRSLLAAVPLPQYPIADPGRGSGERGVDLRRYPVTGTYNPEQYRERGGRATASGMERWGVDYDTYRTNID